MERKTQLRHGAEATLVILIQVMWHDAEMVSLVSISLVRLVRVHICPFCDLFAFHVTSSSPESSYQERPVSTKRASFTNTRFVDAQVETSQAESNCSRMLSLVPAHSSALGQTIKGIRGSRLVRWKRVLFVFANIHSVGAMSSPKVRISGSTDERSQITVRSRILLRLKRSRRMLFTNVRKRLRTVANGYSRVLAWWKRALI
ncbi:unnamed protein product [Nesidiocoris tenuis]|uniref:Uncharacterized protein n=1 Tax=Nesidiocoris tenuis TaxID=355587 RepID=A0A6H5GXZ9_9HEMI|nr:unnamed protein product [Nesidiocoris tenuis]